MKPTYGQTHPVHVILTVQGTTDQSVARTLRQVADGLENGATRLDIEYPDSTISASINRASKEELLRAEVERLTENAARHDEGPTRERILNKRAMALAELEARDLTLYEDAQAFIADFGTEKAATS